jgi:hypothetical protein
VPASDDTLTRLPVESAHVSESGHDLSDARQGAIAGTRQRTSSEWALVGTRSTAGVHRISLGTAPSPAQIDAPRCRQASVVVGGMSTQIGPTDQSQGNPETGPSPYIRVRPDPRTHNTNTRCPLRRAYVTPERFWATSHRTSTSRRRRVVPKCCPYTQRRHCGLSEPDQRGGENALSRMRLDRVPDSAKTRSKRPTGCPHSSDPGPHRGFRAVPVGGIPKAKPFSSCGGGLDRAEWRPDPSDPARPRVVGSSRRRERHRVAS